MKLNKTILVGIIFIIIAAVLFKSDYLTSIIRPVTYLFLMGSSKGKDIMFFALLGGFIILSQMNIDLDENRYLKAANILGSLILISGVILEVIFRLNYNIGLNTIFMNVKGGFASTSILHTHLLKSVFGEIIRLFLGNVGSGINTGDVLYQYVPPVGNVIFLFIILEFVFIVLSLQKRSPVQTISLSFFASCLIIGTIDGGLFSTPAIVGICGIYLVYRNGHIWDEIIDKNLAATKFKVFFKNSEFLDIKYLLKRFTPYFLAAFIIFLRLSICVFGACDDYYTLNIENPEDIDLGDFSVIENRSTTYIISNEYNEMTLLNDLKTPLGGKCDYYTLSWNFYSYF